MHNIVPLGRIAQSQEVSKMALFCLKNASYIKGALIPVEGRLILNRPNYFVKVI